MALSLPMKRQKEHHTKKKGEKIRKSLTAEYLKTLGFQLLSSRAHINNLSVLLYVLSSSSPDDHVLESIISLQSFFLPLLPEISSISSLSKQTIVEEDLEASYRSWLRARFDEFINSLIALAVSDATTEAIKEVAVDAAMDFVKQEMRGRINFTIYHKLLKSMVHNSTSANPLLNLLATKYFKFIDIRYFTYTSLDKILKDCDSAITADDRKFNLQYSADVTDLRLEASIRTVYDVLSCIPPLEELDEQQSYEMWSQMMPSRVIKKFKLRFSKAWRSLLKLRLPPDVYKEVLATLHQNVIPYMSHPTVLCDFLTRSYDIGGVISVMALNGLFILMTQHGLEYPKFYDKLYALLKPDVFMVKYRCAFFQELLFAGPCYFDLLGFQPHIEKVDMCPILWHQQLVLLLQIFIILVELLDTCLKSSYLPAYLAAAFAKKLSRLSLSAPPSGELIIIALTHNLLRRHPSINFLVHQQVDDLVNGGTFSYCDVPDSFNNEESDPIKSNAMRSSLWEIDTLRHHYCPAVSRFITSLENDLTVRAKTSEMCISDFSSGSYATIFNEEVRRRIKQCPIAFYVETPTSLFGESEFPSWSYGSGL